MNNTSGSPIAAREKARHTLQKNILEANRTNRFDSKENRRRPGEPMSPTKIANNSDIMICLNNDIDSRHSIDRN